MNQTWKVMAHRDVKKKDIPLLEQANLKNDFDEIIASLKNNPFKNFRNFEKLNPKNKKIYSLRINKQHRVVYTVNKKKNEVKIWSAWSHYEKRTPNK